MVGCRPNGHQRAVRESFMETTFAVKAASAFKGLETNFIPLPTSDSNIAAINDQNHTSRFTCCPR